QTLAFMANLVTGSFGTNNSFQRQDMVAATESIDLNQLSQEDAETLILSVWDPYDNREVLTKDGAERLMMSLHAGALRIGDPALANVYIDLPTRQAIYEDLQERIYIEGLTEYDLTPDEANDRMNKIMHGYPNNPSATPLADVIWSRGDFEGQNGISYNPTQDYVQLNTTFVRGPDGKMWATGVGRDTLFTFFGLNPLDSSMARGETLGLPTDGLLNATDPVLNITTGMRSLARAEDQHVPNTEDLH